MSEPQLTEGARTSARLLADHVTNILLGCGFSKVEISELFRNTQSVRQQQPITGVTDLALDGAMAASMAILRWRNDPEFTDEQGLPRILSTSPSKAEFQSLVSKVSTDLQPDRVLEHLIATGTIEFVMEGYVRLLSESVVACSGKDRRFLATESVLAHVAGFLSSVEFNLFDKASTERGRFERACYVEIPCEHVPIFLNMARQRSQDFVNAIDEWLVRRSSPADGSMSKQIVGVGAYTFVR